MNEVQDKVRAYLVLAHAAIEEYIEQIILDVIETEYNRWQNEVTQSRPVIEVFVSRSFEHAQNTIRQNHGIKTRNLKKLLGLVGINAEDPTQIDETWLNDMDSFGTLRGGIAHNSGASVTITISPAEAKRKVDNLLRGLRELDRELQRLKY